MNVLSLFDGMSCGQIALREAGIPIDKYYASEIDPHAIKQTQYMFPDTVQVGDIQMLRAEQFPRIDLVVGGSPCQGFSLSGSGLNFNHPESRLFFEFERLWYEVKAINPEAIFLLENVVMRREHQRVINERMGVFPVRLNSNLVSAQNRDRLYWTNGRVKRVGLFGELHTDIPKPKDREVYFPQILDDGVPSKYKLSEKAFDYINRDEMNMRYVQFHNNAKANPITANYRKGVPYNVLLTEDGLRHLTPKECSRLQTIPEWYLWHPDISDTQKYKMLGNGWTIEMIKHILSHVIPDPKVKNS